MGLRESSWGFFRGIRYWRRYKARRPIAFLPVCCEFCCQNVSFNIFFKLIWKYKKITKRIHLVCMHYPHCLTTHEGSQCVPSALPINSKYIRKWKIILAIEKKISEKVHTNVFPILNISMEYYTNNASNIDSKTNHDRKSWQNDLWEHKKC